MPPSTHAGERQQAKRLQSQFTGISDPCVHLPTLRIQIIKLVTNNPRLTIGALPSSETLVAELSGEVARPSCTYSTSCLSHRSCKVHKGHV